MSKLKAILTLIRFPNLLFILLTQVLCYVTLILPNLHEQHETPTLNSYQIAVFIFSTVLIAAAGYIINDYFDIGTDAINKPERVTIEKIFKRRSIIIGHVVLNLIALALTGAISYHMLKFRFLGIQLICIFLLLVYSTTFKRKLIIGNVIIALLTALTLLSMAWYEPKFPLWQWTQLYTRYFWMFTGFAFVVTLIREIIKDIEDIKGDNSIQCRTIPLVWGINSAKNLVIILIAILLIGVVLLGTLFFTHNWPLLFYFSACVVIPFLLLIIDIRQAKTSFDFNKISTRIKIITLLGILSMLFL